MNGLTVLNTSIQNDSLPIIACFMLGVCVAVIVYMVLFGLCALLDNAIPNTWSYQYIIAFLVVLSVISGSAFGNYQYHKSANENKDYNVYQVTINDDVKFNEFNDKYIVRYQDGELFTIIERKDLE